MLANISGPMKIRTLIRRKKRQLQQQRRELRAVLGNERPERVERAEQRQLGAEEPQHQVDGDQGTEQERRGDQQALEELAPEPDPAAGDDVLLGQLVVGAIHARPGQEATHDDVDQAAERGDGERREDQRERQAHAQAAVQPDKERRGREETDDRGRATQAPPFHGQRDVLLAHGRGEALLFGVRHALVRRVLRSDLSGESSLLASSNASPGFRPSIFPGADKDPPNESS
jgi:hypothetical protein